MGKHPHCWPWGWEMGVLAAICIAPGPLGLGWLGVRGTCYTNLAVRHAILADIHSNLAALQAVLTDLGERGGADELWCLGDIVGYGPDPRECIALIRSYPHQAIVGNHDLGAIGRIPLDEFNPEAAAACRWNGAQLGPKEVAYLEGLPLTLVRDGFTLVHGSPREPIWEYLVLVTSARRNFDYFNTELCLVGHSHIPLYFELVSEDSSCLRWGLSEETSLRLGGRRLIINPGGVGQPRDGDPRAAYAIYDSTEKTLYHYRVPYDIAETQRRMVERGLPLRLAQRLSYGM